MDTDTQKKDGGNQNFLIMEPCVFIIRYRYRLVDRSLLDISTTCSLNVTTRNSIKIKVMTYLRVIILVQE